MYYKNKILKLIKNIAYKNAITSMKVTCFGFVYQPKSPKKKMIENGKLYK